MSGNKILSSYTCTYYASFLPTKDKIIQRTVDRVVYDKKK